MSGDRFLPWLIRLEDTMRQMPDTYCRTSKIFVESRLIHICRISWLVYRPFLLLHCSPTWPGSAPECFRLDEHNVDITAVMDRLIQSSGYTSKILCTRSSGEARSSECNKTQISWRCTFLNPSFLLRGWIRVRIVVAHETIFPERGLVIGVPRLDTIHEDPGC